MANFTCNVCGAACERGAEPPGREVPSCAQCGSTVRLRGLVAVLTREIFGVEQVLPHVPALKDVRGFGMSDPPALAARLAEKFDYTNTFYHQPPVLDITNPPEDAWGTYDFIVSSEVMEHVPPPVERGFANLYRLLKPNGVLVLTVPYAPWPQHTEHYPELHEYVLAAPGGRTVLVNRRRDGSIEVFENLCFHGGDGSTLEMRVFSETSLKGVMTGAGFDEVQIASESVAEFGVDHAETWSLPIVARKGKFVPPAGEIVKMYAAVSRKVSALEREVEILRGEYARYVAFHEQSHKETEEELAKRAAWAMGLDRELNELRARLWVRVGRKVGGV